MTADIHLYRFNLMAPRPPSNRWRQDPRRTFIDRRSGDDNRKVYSLDYFFEGGVERRSGVERRRKGERRRPSLPGAAR